MWVRFTAGFDWKPRPAVTIAYLSGQERNVPRDCADRAIAAGKALTIAPKRREAPDGKAGRA